ncbi:MAG: porin [Planctomycetota bacterium]|nr:porin [Planctomycetota bacterium]
MLCPLLLALLPHVPAQTVQESTPQPPKVDPGSLRLRYEDGLVFEFGTGKLVVEGLFEVGAFVTEGGASAARDPDSDTYVKRMRPEFAGQFDGGWRFRFEPKFDDSGVELEEAWVGREIFDGEALLRLGRMKAPFGLEELRSRRHIHFPRFSILNQFSPAEDHGLFVTGREGRFEYGMAVYNGTGGSEQDDGKDIALSGMWHSANPIDSKANWQVGAALTYGKQGQSVGGDPIKNASGQPVLEFAPGAELDGDRLRLALQGAWFSGPLMIQAEALSVQQEVTGGGASEDMDLHGFYVDIARSLTGNDLDFGGVHDPDDSWLLALRLSSLQIGDDLETPGLLTPGTYADSIDSVSLGLHWIPGSHMIVRHAWTHSWYGDTVTIDGADVDDEGMFTVELQLHF